MLTIQDTPINNDAWDTFIMRHPTGTLFHKTSWLEILAETQSLKVKKVSFYEEGVLVGVLPIFIKDHWPLRVGGSPFVVEDTPYLGLVIDKCRYKEAVESLGSYMKKSGIHFLRIIQRDEISQEMRPRDFQVIAKHSHLLDLTKTENEIFNSFEGRCRTAIRKAEKNGVRIKQETCRGGIEDYYAILEDLYFGQNMVTPNPKFFYYLLWDAFVGHQLHMLTAWYDEKLVAGAIIIHDRDRCYYLNGASRFEYNSLCPNNLIQWEAIRVAKSLGAIWYDFVGSDIERLAKFKKSFGGKLMIYSCLEKSSSAWVGLIRKKYPEFKMLMGRIKSRFSEHHSN